MKVLLLSRFGRLGASSRLRFYQYLPYLKARGIDVTVAPLLSDAYLTAFYSGHVKHVETRLVPYLRRLILLWKCRDFDFLWVETEILPWLPPWVEVLLARAGVRSVVDYNDASFHRYDQHSNTFVRRVLGEKIDVVMRFAARVIVGNDYLATRARRAGARDIVCLPTVVDLRRYRVEHKSTGTPFTVGWVGTPLTVHYLDSLRSVLYEFLKCNNSNFVIVGGSRFDLQAVPVVFRPWSEDTEVSDVRNFDVGIMPLSDGPWEQGKCGYKLIQYMACCKPVIASPVGVNSKIVDHGVNGFLASTGYEWYQALSTLRDNPQLRRDMGEAARRKVEREYCLEVTAPRLFDIMTDITKGRKQCAE